MFFTTELRDANDALFSDQGAVFRALSTLPLLDASPCRLINDGKHRVIAAEVTATGRSYEGRLYRTRTGDFPSVRSVVEDAPDRVLELGRGEGLTASAHFHWRDLSGMKTKTGIPALKEGLLVAEFNSEAPRVGRIGDYVEDVFGDRFKLTVRPIFRSDVFENLKRVNYMVQAIDVRIQAKEAHGMGFAPLFAAASDKNLGSVSMEYRASRKRRIDVGRDVKKLRDLASKMTEDDRLTVRVNSSTLLDLLGTGALKVPSNEVPVLPNSRSLDPKMMLKELRDVVESQFDEIAASLGLAPHKA